jgi:PIN domain nuclease of toxin-antitoxin system
VRLLLDTHIMLWALQGSRSLPGKARRLIDGADEIRVSSVSLWEVAIKRAGGKVTLDPARIKATLEGTAFLELPVAWVHAVAVDSLPALHHDPFDRLLVAQALHERLSLLTHDEALAPYSPTIIVV